MKQNLTKILLLLLVLCSVASCAVGCKNNKEPSNTNTEQETLDSILDNKYDFPETIKLKDNELNIFNLSEFHNAIIYVDTEDYSDKIPQAVYDRNRGFEEHYGVLVNETKFQFTTNRKTTFNNAMIELNKLHQAGDDLYDAVYVSLYDQASLLSSGYLRDMNSISTLNLTAEWWDPTLTSSYMLNDGKCYVASSPLNLMSYETTYVNFFNPAIVEQRNIENMFALVRSGEWTIEKMLNIITESGVVTPNSDGSFTFDGSGTAVYGMAVHTQSPMRFLRGADISFVNLNAKGKYRFTCNNADGFYQISDLLLRLFDIESGYVTGTDVEDQAADHPEGYVPVFNAGRSLFLNAELKCGMTLKKKLNTEVVYSILPMPKYNQEQKSYISECSNNTLMMAVPILNSDAEAAGLALDTLSYMSYRDVLPIYYNDYISYRGLNDADSLEMLNQYIMPGRCLELGLCYGWTADFVDTYNKILGHDVDESLANILTVNARGINDKIKSFLGE